MYCQTKSECNFCGDSHETVTYLGKDEVADILKCAPLQETPRNACRFCALEARRVHSFVSMVSRWRIAPKVRLKIQLGLQPRIKAFCRCCLQEDLVMRWLHDHEMYEVARTCTSEQEGSPLPLCMLCSCEVQRIVKLRQRMLFNIEPHDTADFTTRGLPSTNVPENIELDELKIEMDDSGIKIEPHGNEPCSDLDTCNNNFCKLEYQSHDDTDDSDYIEEVERFSCDLCMKTFKHERNLKAHIQLHNGSKHFRCNICAKEFSHPSSLRLHIRGHMDDKRYKCEVCNLRFVSKALLKQHAVRHTDLKPFKCRICEKSFSAKGVLKLHVRTHTGEKPFACHLCDRRFAQGGDLKRHVAAHNGEKLYVCEICSRPFSRSYDIRRHMLTHTHVKRERKHECHICSRMFYDRSNLRRHVRVHTGERPYACDVCGRGFSEGTSLKKHRLTHASANEKGRQTSRKHRCSICDKRFINVGDLRNHRRTHTGERPFECDFCDRRYAVRSNLLKHRRACHGQT